MYQEWSRSGATPRRRKVLWVAEQEMDAEKGVRLLVKQHSMKRQPTKNSLNFRCLDRLESPCVHAGEDVKSTPNWG